MNDSTTTFLSPTNNLRLVEKAARRKPLGEHGDFENIPGVTHEFTEGRLVVSDPETIEWLRDHEALGQLFYEVGNEPDRPGESTAKIHQAIIDHAFNGEFDKIADILVQERTTLSRPDVIAACEAALNKGGEDEPPLPETPEHEIERVRLGPASGPQAGQEDLVPTTTEEGTPAAEPAPEETPAEPEPAPE